MLCNNGNNNEKEKEKKIISIDNIYIYFLKKTLKLCMV